MTAIYEFKEANHHRVPSIKMNNNVYKLNEVKLDIERSFADAPPPEFSEIVYDDSPRHLEGQWIRNSLAGCHWQKLTCADLLEHEASIYFMTPVAFRFFLPAYLICSLNPIEADAVADSIINSLSPPPLGVGTTEEFMSRISLLQSDELSSVASFFRYFDTYHRDSYPDDIVHRSLEQFWSKY
jgi:hypothetical protein